MEGVRGGSGRSLMHFDKLQTLTENGKFKEQKN